MIEAIKKLAATSAGRRKSAPILASVILGFMLSPAFTFGTFARSCKGMLVALAASFAWSAACYWYAYKTVWWNTDGKMSATIAGNVDVLMNDMVLTQTCVGSLAFLFAGCAVGWIYDNHRNAWVPLLALSLAFAGVYGAQVRATTASEAYFRAEGTESGKMGAVYDQSTKMWQIFNSTGETDREKLLLLYAGDMGRRTVFGVEKDDLTFEEYLNETARKCSGFEPPDDAICKIGMIEQRVQLLGKAAN